MKKEFYIFLRILIIIVLVVSYFFEGTLLSFYSDYSLKTQNIAAGSVSLAIENLRLETNGVEKTEEEISQSNSFLRVNKSNAFSFVIKNASDSDISYSLEIQIAWDGDINESGKLLLYPYEISDELIYQNLQSGNYLGAFIGFDALDNKNIEISTGNRTGISEVLDTGFFIKQKSGADKNDESSKEYKYKIFFYENADVFLNPEIYHNKNIEINLIANAVLYNSSADWTSNEKKSFTVTSVIDTIFPVIYEISKPKTFFTTQTQNINLNSYARAIDIFDGDISEKININSSPQFDSRKAGIYNITFTVSNSFGNPAASLHITVIIWDFIKITSGYYHTLALTSHGKVYVWGYNAYGQLGDGTNSNSSVPKQLESLNNIIDVAAGVGCSFALSSNGQVYSWGRNENGRLGDGTTSGKNKPVKVSQPNGLKFIQISARYSTAGGVTANGDVYTWGYGGYGAAGTNKTGDNHVPTKIDISNAAQLELGYYNGAAVTNDGKVYTWGSNTYGALGTGAAASTGPNPITLVPYFEDNDIKIKQVSVGYYHIAAVSKEGRAFTWGYGYEGRLGNGSTSNKFIPQEIVFPVPVKKALAGYYHTGVLTDDGTAYFFGQNTYGKLGNGNTSNQSMPVQLQGIANVYDFSLALDSTFVLSSGIEVYGMGYGGTGVLGTGNNNNSNVAVKWAFIPPEPY